MSANTPNSIKLYYFSGTGNAAAVSTWITQEARLQGRVVDKESLSGINRRKIPTPLPDSMIGFVSATHGFNFPPIMFHFIMRFPRGSGNRVFIVNTRAGMKLGKYFLPGLSGMALYLSAIILLLKGYKIQALKAVDLPSNWISVHPGLKKKVCGSINERRKAETEVFAQKLLEGKVILTGLYPLIIDFLITPIGVLYYFVGRFFLAKTFIASRDCTSCGICDQSCPVGAIKVLDNRRFWTYKCESCMQCMNQCPERAIETAHGFAALAVLVPDTLVFLFINNVVAFEHYIAMFLPEFIVGFTTYLVKTAMMLGIVFLGYRLMHFLMRFRLFERLFVLSSFTHWRFWRRYNFNGKTK